MGYWNIKWNILFKIDINIKNIILVKNIYDRNEGKIEFDLMLKVKI